MLERIPRALDTSVLSSLTAAAPGAVWLDTGSCRPGCGRFSVVGVDPFLTWRVEEGRSIVARAGMESAVSGNPWEALRDCLEEFRSAPGPFPLAGGGAIGYLGYDMGRYLERLPALKPRRDSLPEAHFAFLDLMTVVDHEAGETWLVSTGHPESGSREARARARLSYLRHLVEKAGSDEPARMKKPPPPVLHGGFSREAYIRAVARAKEYIAAGDIYQVNLSQGFWAELSTDPILSYRRLRAATPVPFGAYLKAGGAAVLCTSPERFLQVRGSEVETRPIKGTRPRGGNAAEDRRLADALLASAKDRAELMMVVDLERNDLSRVCLPGTVDVPRLCGLESYANVHHLVATVTGSLRPDLGVVDLLRASFPGGSITGVPKIRAMEIIEELEPARRGIYTGCLGYLEFTGDADLNIAIRTAWTDGDKLHFQAGGAVTADSDPEAEYEETLHKASGLLKAVGLEEVNLDGLVLD